MFEVYPGFERVTLRAKIEWLGRVRPVAVRFEQWPLDEFLILGVLRFEDEIDGGEWVIIDHLGAGFFSSGRLGSERVKRKWAKEIIAITKAFLHQQRFKQLGLLLKIPLPNHPQYMVSVPDMVWIPTRRRAAFVGNYWLDATTPYEDFGLMCSHCLYEKFESAISPFQQTPNEVCATLMKEWSDVESDAHFAWQWTRWNQSEKIALSVGTMENRSDLKRVACLVLQCADIWENAENWEWNLSLISDDHNEIRSNRHVDAKFHSNLRPWLEVLRVHFAPQRRGDWFEKHGCVRDFWRQLKFDEVEPKRGTIKAQRLESAHEQLEAKLALRDWLADKATPDVAARLLATLEGSNTRDM